MSTRTLRLRTAMVVVGVALASNAPGMGQAPTTDPCSYVTFTGTIGTLPIAMRLCVLGHAIYGTYFYLHRGEDLTLAGSVLDDGRLTIVETAEDERTRIVRPTGVFRGRMQNGQPVLDQWSSLDGHRTLPIVLRSLRSVRPTLFLMHTVSLCSLFFQPHPSGGPVAPPPIWIDVKIPMIAPAGDSYAARKFDSFIRRWANEHAPPCTMGPQDTLLSSIPPTTPHDEYLLDYSVEADTPDIIIVWFEMYQNRAGIPNGMSSTLSFNYDMARARFLHLEDLFSPGSDYAQRISAYSIQHLWDEWLREPGRADTRARDWLEHGAGPDPANFQAFAVTPTGLRIKFQTNQVAPYVRGRPEVTVPWEILQPMLRPGTVVDAVKAKKP